MAETPVQVAPEEQPVDGLITAVGAKGLVEISLGTDDGVQKGRLLDVHRIADGQGIYVGRITVRHHVSQIIAKLGLANRPRRPPKPVLLARGGVHDRGTKRQFADLGIWHRNA